MVNPEAATLQDQAFQVHDQEAVAAVVANHVHHPAALQVEDAGNLNIYFSCLANVHSINGVVGKP